MHHVFEATIALVALIPLIFVEIVPPRACRVQIILLACLFGVMPAHAETFVFHASQSGKQTLDQGEEGGNPFASALVEILARPSVNLSSFPTALQQLTLAKSEGFQSPDVPTSVKPANWSLVPAQPGESRIALVMVVSHYARSGARTLPGAKYDAERIASALLRAGFVTELALNLDLAPMREKLATFAMRSKQYDVAAIYTTGHGSEVGGLTYLLPGDYPLHERNRALPVRALPLREIARSAHARSLNLVFYGGCRDNPFQE
jgi:Caspase domain